MQVQIWVQIHRIILLGCCAGIIKLHFVSNSAMSPELFAVIAISIVRLAVLLAVFLYLHAINLDNAPCELCSALCSRRERRNAKLRQRKLWKKAFRRTARTMRMLREADAWLRRNRGIMVTILCRAICMSWLLFFHAILMWWCSALLRVDLTGMLELAWLSFMEKQAQFERKRTGVLLYSSRLHWQREHCRS